MEISQQLAEVLGFPKAHYRIVERERRWTSRQIPTDQVRSAERITDTYIFGTRLRLREARPVDGSLPMLRLSRKADADDTTRLISSIYLSEDDFSALRRGLPGVSLQKIRHRLQAPHGISMCVDEFEGTLSGLIIFEAEFANDEKLECFETPKFAIREITGESRYSGFSLATDGMPLDV